MEGRNKPVTRSSAAVYPHDAARSSPNSHDNDQRPFPDIVVPILLFLCLVVTFGLMAFLLTGLYISDVYTPRLPELHVGSFSVSNFTSNNGSRVSFVAEIRLTSLNPSGKVSISYDHIVAGMYYKWMLLSQSSLPPFSQEAENKTSLVVKLAADGNLVEKWVVDGINGDIGQNGSVEFDFSLNSWVNWEAKSWVNVTDVLKVFCGDLTVAIPSNGMSVGLLGPPGHCRVGRRADDNDIRYKNNFA